MGYRYFVTSNNIIDIIYIFSDLDCILYLLSNIKLNNQR